MSATDEEPVLDDEDDQTDAGDERRRGLLAWAALELAADLTACEALLNGEPVPRHRLNLDALGAIGEPLEGPDVVLDVELARRLELRLPHAARAKQAKEPPPEPPPPPPEPEPPAPEAAEPPQEEQRPRLCFLPAGVFMDQVLADIEPLWGTGDDGVIVPLSFVILAGQGGAGKSTFEVFAALHYAAGAPLFGIPMPRPIRIVIVENEGPHDYFVKKVRDMAARWRNCPCGCGAGDGGESFRENVLILDAPWAEFTLDDPMLAEVLRLQAVEFGADMVMANPLGSIGMKGAGTPEETRAFRDLLARAGLWRDFGAWVNHHMVKYRPNVPISQQLSGDWGPHPDTIMILEEDGQRRSKLTFAKVRHGDQGRPPLLLEWLTDDDGPIGYRAHEADVSRTEDEDILLRIDAYLTRVDGPQGVMDIRKNVVGKNERISLLLRQGELDGRYLNLGSDTRPRYMLADLHEDGDGEPALDDQTALPWD